MECSASYPIEWIYEGYGTPNLRIENDMQLLKLNSNHIKNSTFDYSTTVVFSNLTEGNTGKYTCRGIDLLENTEIFFHVYTMGESTFLFPKTKYIDINEEESFGYVPCVNTDPLLRNVTLFKGEPKDELNPSQYQYDPVYGFRLNWTIFDNPNDLYTCVSTPNFDEGGQGHSLQFLAVKSIVAGAFKVTPPEHFIPHEKLQEKAIFACHSQTEVTIEVIFNEDPSILPPEGMISYEPDETEGFPYTGKATISTANYENTFITIHCVNKVDNRTFHFWEFSPFGPNHIDEFQQENYNFSCCTTSFHTPVLRRVICDSSQSCDLMRKKTLPYVTPEDDIDIEMDSNTGRKCLVWTLNSTIHEFGVLQCSLTLEYVEKEFNSTREMWYSHSEFKHSPSTLIEMDELILPSPVEQVLTVQKLSTEDIIGLESEFLCEANSLFFSRGLQWGIEFTNGTTSIVPQEEVVGNEVRNLTINIRQSHFVLYSLDVKSVFCTAPLWNSVDWEHSSVDVKLSNASISILSINMSIILLLCGSLILNMTSSI